ncbi:MAG: hypothetical protein RDV48_30210 [Candidatus Eremiobacteraeota bacterium]|nr:hypothetical protein [Candidatus Eremiobacteraeota bacterium]
MASDILFSDRHRALKIVIVIIILFVCGLATFHYGRSLPSLVFLPAARDTAAGLNVLSYYTVSSIDGEGITVRDRKVHVRVQGPFENVRRGDIISVVGVRTGDSMEMKRYHVHRGRFLKKAVSLAAMAFLLSLSFRFFRFDRATWSLAPRELPATPEGREKEDERA